jgi:hypothetical protein
MRRRVKRGARRRLSGQFVARHLHAGATAVAWLRNPCAARPQQAPCVARAGKSRRPQVMDIDAAQHCRSDFPKFFPMLVQRQRREVQMPKSQRSNYYHGPLQSPLLRRIGHRLDPKVAPFGYSGGAESWRKRVEALRAYEAQRVADGLKALGDNLGVSQPAEWPSQSRLTSREKYFCDIAWALARRHVPAFKHLDTPVWDSKSVAQEGQEGAAPAIDTALLHSIEYYRRVLAKEANDGQVQLPPNGMAKKVLELIKQIVAQNCESLPSRPSYRRSVPHLKTVERLLEQIDGAFDAVLNGCGTSIQCEYVEHVCPTLDGLDEKPWL